MYSLKELNKHPHDSRIKFRDEGHKYWIDNDDIDIISATSFIHTFFNDFDTDSIINNILNSKKYKDPEYKYYGMSSEEIKKLWNDSSEEARNEGTKLHKDIENFYNKIDTEIQSPDFYQFLQFYENHKDLKIYRTEWFVFCDILRITGSIDAVFINDDGSLTIGDWKRSKEINFESYNEQTGKWPLDHIPDSNYYHYSIQLNLYKRILEKFYGQRVKNMFLIIMHPKNKNEKYIKIDVKCMSKEIDLMFNIRKNELVDKGYDINKLNELKLEHTLEPIVENTFYDEDKPIKSFLNRNKNIEKIIKPVKEVQTKMVSIDKLTFNSLSEKQKVAYRNILEGKSVFLTGKAGSGKSGVINLFYKQYRYKKHIGMTSTTGTSAILINGVTLHSFLGIGLGTADVEFLYMNIKNKGHILKRWLELDVLIIDEISMLSPKLFDKLENLARVVRKNELPFGGIQLILTGDFLQLPCVDSVKFCFESESWNKCVNKIIYLTENFRQNDLEFHKCLSEVRIGELSPESIKLLKSCEDNKLENGYGILPTKIYALNKNVDEENIQEINKLFEKDNELQFYEYQLEYEVLKKGFRNPEDKIKKACNAPSLLELCKGVQVMLLYNMDLEAKLANGSRGVVIDFVDDLPLVKFLTGEERIIDYYTWKVEENGTTIMTITQLPLKIAYAITVHRSQGLTVDYAEVDMEGIFEDGMAYVALSRVTNKEGLRIKNFRLGNIFANQKAVKFYKDLE